MSRRVQLCTNRCNGDRNKNIASFSLALRCCSHTRWIDSTTMVEPLSDDSRSDFKLDPLDSKQKSRNRTAEKMMQKYESDGGADTFKDWLRSANQRVLSEF